MATEPVVTEKPDQASAAVDSQATTTPAAPEPEKATAEPSGEPVAAESGESEEQFISDEDFEKLQDDPAALRKHFQKVFTQKTQQYKPGYRLLQALSDPERRSLVLTELAKHSGFKLSKAEAEAVESAEPDPMEDLRSTFVQVLGEDAAGKALSAIERLVEGRLGPLKEAAKIEAVKRASAENEAAITTLTQKYPDWRKHEKGMIAVSQRLRPEGINRVEYLEVLYTIASSQTSMAEAINKALGKTVTAARAIAESRVEGETTTTDTSTGSGDTAMSLRDALKAGMEAARKKG
jgi:hypothetical protein